MENSCKVAYESKPVIQPNRQNGNSEERKSLIRMQDKNFLRANFALAGIERQNDQQNL